MRTTDALALLGIEFSRQQTGVHPWRRIERRQHFRHCLTLRKTSVTRSPVYPQPSSKSAITNFTASWPKRRIVSGAVEYVAGSCLRYEPRVDGGSLRRAAWRNQFLRKLGHPAPLGSCYCCQREQALQPVPIEAFHKVGWPTIATCAGVKFA